MTIQLDENYSLETDISSWALKFEKVGSINKDTLKPTISRDATYHGTLKQALIAYTDKALKDCTSIKEVLTRLDEIEMNINDSLDDMKAKLASDNKALFRAG